MSPAPDQSARRTRKRKSRSGAPGENPHMYVPYITRNIPPYDILDEESLTKIEATTDRILAEIGMELRDDPEVVRLFREAGATVTELSSTRWNLKFEPGMIREILKTAPAIFTQHARQQHSTRATAF